MVGKVVFGATKLPVVGQGSDLVQPTHGVSPAPGATLSSDQVKDLNFRELAILIPLAGLAIYIGLQPNGMLEAIKPAYQSTAQMTVSRVSQQISAEFRAANPLPPEQESTRPAPKPRPQTFALGRPDCHWYRVYWCRFGLCLYYRWVLYRMQAKC
jgi:hypothetical protein